MQIDTTEDRYLEQSISGSFAAGLPDVCSDEVPVRPGGSLQWACAHMSEPRSLFRSIAAGEGLKKAKLCMPFSFYNQE